MLVLSKHEKQEIIDYLKDEFWDITFQVLFDKFVELYLDNYINGSDADVLRTAALDFLVQTERNDDPSEEDIEDQIELWREDT